MDRYCIHSSKDYWRYCDIVGGLIFRYDKVGDILYYIDKCSPYPEQESDEIGDEMIARFNPDSGEIENLEILFFSKRLFDANILELPVIANMRLAAS